MDGFITLIILVIVFNLLSAVMRAIKGGNVQNRSRQQSVQKLPPAFGADQIFPFAVKGEFGDPEEQEYETEPGADSTFENERFTEYDEYDGEPEDLQEQTVASLPEPVVHAVRKQTAEASVIPGIKKVLTEKDSFLAAFVLHEILDTQPFLRHRGKR